MFAWLGLLLVYKSGEHFATGMLRAFLVDARYGLGAVGRLLGGVGFTGGLLGALIGGATVNRLGRRNALIVFGVLQALSVAAYALAVGRASLPLMYLLTGVEHVTSGMATAALFTG
jgi:MFS transporter, PAT family, beta-lactamase induction signal transducer AmpG